MEIRYNSRRQQTDVTYRYYPALLKIARASDIRMVVVPAGLRTNGLVDANVIKTLCSNGVLINEAPGTIVDDKTLIDALATGRLLAAGFDIFAHEPQVPHEVIALRTR